MPFEYHVVALPPNVLCSERFEAGISRLQERCVTAAVTYSVIY